MKRVLAQDVCTDHDLPRFDNSAVDGYAVSPSDLGHGSIELELLGTIAAGSMDGLIEVRSGTTVQVMTGAPVPVGTAAVVMQEDVTRADNRVTIREAQQSGKHLRSRGGEFKSGDCVVSKGTCLNPPHLGAIASTGKTHCSVFLPPKLKVIVTGKELAAPGSELLPFQIYESNSIGLIAVLQGLGITSETVFCDDDREVTSENIRASLEGSDALLTSGGVSVGQFDFVRGALEELGFETVVSRVSVKPGKPFTFATRSDGKVVFGLPGNPMSALVTFSLFAYPFLRQAMGLGRTEPRFAVCQSEHQNLGDRTELLPGRSFNQEAVCCVTTEEPIGSHAVSGLAAADVLVQVPPGAKVSPGDIVRIHVLPWSAA